MVRIIAPHRSPDKSLFAGFIVAVTGTIIQTKERQKELLPLSHKGFQIFFSPKSFIFQRKKLFF